MHYVDVSAGNPLTAPARSGGDAVLHHFRLTEAVKQATPLVVMGSAYSFLGNGENRLPGVCTEERSFEFLGGKNVAEGRVDLVGVGRQSFADPLFARKILDGTGEIDFCTLCNGCRKLLRSQKQTGCAVYDPYYRALLKEG
jgi:2,4-dienoyl-CoA reductase-like NADH-dependent reductase (Old Yellow Enzyme family)